MSSDLKDARFQLARDMATEDGKNFWSMRYQDRTAYLDAAQYYLEGASEEDIAKLAKKWREE